MRSIFLWRGTAYQRIALQNHGDLPASFDLTLLFDNDFADLFEVRGERRPRRGVGSSRLLGPADVVLEYNGLDGQVRITALHFEPRPTRLATHSATFHFELAPKEATALFVAVASFGASSKWKVAESVARAVLGRGSKCRAVIRA